MQRDKLQATRGAVIGWVALSILLALTACSGASELVSTETPAPKLTFTANPTPAQTTAPPGVPPYPVLPGGFQFDLPETYFVNPVIAPMRETWQDPRSILLAAADYTTYGPFIRLGGGYLTPPWDGDRLLAHLRQDRADFDFQLGETQPMRTETGLSGSGFTFTFPIKDSSGTGQVILLTSATQYVYLMAAAPKERWDALSADLRSVLDSLEFIPIQPAQPDIAGLTYLPKGAAPPTPYHLGFTTLTLPQEWAQDLPPQLMERAVELKGIISVPPGEGPFSLAVILHGRDKTICEPHLAQYVSPYLIADFCPPGTREVRYDVGFAALTAALAQGGIAAVSIDVNEGYLVSQSDFSIFNERSNPLDARFVPMLVRQHLMQLENVNAGSLQLPGVDLTGKLDLSRVVLIGHSRGGQNALALAQDLPGVRGLLMIAPANDGLFSVPADLPFAVLTPSCDGDLIDWQGQGYYEQAVVDDSRDQPGASTMLGFANHNYFNGLLEMKDDSARKINNDECRQEDSILTQERTQAFLLQYASAFAAAAFSDNPASEFPPFDPAEQSASQRYGSPVLENALLPARRRAVLLGPEQMRLPGALQSETRLERMDCNQGEVCHPLLSGQEITLPGNPAVTRLAWDSADAALQFTFTPQPLNASRFDQLSLRLALDLTDERNRLSQTDVILQMRDVNGKLSTVTLRTPPPFHTQPSLDYGWGGIPIQLSTLRVPVKDFTGINLDAISSLTLLFPAERGALYLADVEFLLGAAAE